MNLDNTLLFFFSALGAFNSLVLGFYFLFLAKTNTKANYFLGGLLLVLSIRVWKSLFYYFNPELSKVYLQIGLSACFFIGPFLFFYTSSNTKNNKTNYTNIYTQLAALFIVTLTIGLIYPYHKHPKLWGTFYTIINLQWLVYILASLFLLKKTFLKLFNYKEKLSYNEAWNLSIFTGVSLIWLAYFTASYTSYISGALSFSFAFYLTGLLLFFKRKNNFITKTKKEKYAATKIATNQAEEILKKITTVMQKEQLYKNPNLTLPILAKKLNMRPQLLSQFVNDNLNKSFSQFINEYRIEEATQILTSQPNIKIEIVAEQCGYNSKSTFYSAFKKITNTTPAKFTTK